jgi:hypothetical protein
MAKNAYIYDGTQWVSIVGPEGPEGPRGPKGDPGEDGKDGSGVTIKGTATVYPPSATPAAGDMYLVDDPVPAGFPPGTQPGDGIVWTGTAWENVGAIRGPKGERGDKGDAGNDGADGADGAPGVDGQAGEDGKSIKVSVQSSQPATATAGDVWINPA